MQTSDEELYRRMRKGDQESFAELYRRREPALYRYGLHMSGSQSVAEEITHEVFIRLMAPTVAFDPKRGSLEGYLYGVARNVMRGILRKGNTEESQDLPVEQDILGGLIRAEALRGLHTALKDLPEPYRDAVVLCDLEERSYEDAARLMQCPVGTVRSRLHRARMILSAKLKPLGASAEVRS